MENLKIMGKKLRGVKNCDRLLRDMGKIYEIGRAKLGLVLGMVVR